MKSPTHLPDFLRRPMVIAALMGSAAFASAQTILIDFGSAESPTSDLGWNNITDGTAVDTPVALVDSTGAATGISATVIARFNGANGIGYAAGTGDFPSSATNDNLFGNTGEFAGVSAPNPTVEFSGLNTTATYDFELYASRTGVSDDRSATYTLSGGNTVSMDFNPSSNEGTTFNLDNLQPDGSGVITLDLVASPSNANSLEFIYLGAVKITAPAVPEPGTFPAYLGAFVLAGLAYRRRKD